MTDPAGGVDILARLRLEQERRGIVENSILAREGRVKALTAWMEPRTVFDAGRGDVEQFLDSLHTSTGTRRAYLSHLHAFYSWAIDEGLTTDDPTAKITRPRGRRGMPRPISEESLATALKLASPQLRCWLLLGALQGLRCQEIAGLEGEHVNRAAETLYVAHGKGGKERTLPLHPAVSAALPDVRGPLFRLTNGNPVKPHNVSHQLNEHLHACGIDDTAHALRHAFATTLYRASRDLRLTQELLGHSSPATTAIYAACDPDGAQIIKTLWLNLPEPGAAA